VSFDEAGPHTEAVDVMILVHPP